MSVPHPLTALAGRYTQLSLRERALVLIAAVTLITGLFEYTLLGPLQARRSRLAQELSGLEAGMNTAASAAVQSANADPAQAADRELARLSAQLREVDAQLTSQAAGMISPQRMIEVIHDVLSRQNGLALVSLRNGEPLRLPAPSTRDNTAAGRPYLHTVEIVLDGRYLDVLAYLRALERLPWHFYWRRLELTSTHYPLSRVRVELGTVSMDSEWIRL